MTSASASWLALGCLSSLAYAGEPYSDVFRTGGPQKIPGAVFCAYYDRGGEGVAYHDADTRNQGSGGLNPADGTYLHEFRKDEGVDTSYVKQIPDRESPCNRMVPPLGLLYVGWTEPGEWFRITVEAAEAGDYTADFLYTANRDATILVGVGDAQAAPFLVPSTFDAAETIPWRQWHHWAVLEDAVTLRLPKGVSVLTVRIVTAGNLNLATFVFRPAGAERSGPPITEFCTAQP